MVSGRQVVRTRSREAARPPPPLAGLSATFGKMVNTLRPRISLLVEAVALSQPSLAAIMLRSGARTRHSSGDDSKRVRKSGAVETMLVVFTRYRPILLLSSLRRFLRITSIAASVRLNPG